MAILENSNIFLPNSVSGEKKTQDVCVTEFAQYAVI